MVGDWQGVAAVILLYILLAYLYAITLFYGFWGFEFQGNDPKLISGWTKFGAFFGTTLYTLVFILMIWSHILTVMTDPGTMPEGYQKLKEEKLPNEFYDLIRERESIYHELVVRKKMRKGEISTQ